MFYLKKNKKTNILFFPNRTQISPKVEKNDLRKTFKCIFLMSIQLIYTLRKLFIVGHTTCAILLFCSCKVGYRLEMASFIESTNACNTECTSNSIYIDWSSLLKSLNEIEADCYTVKYKLVDSKKFLRKETNDAHDNSIVLDGLKANSEYEILLFASKDGIEDKIHRTKVKTKKSMADALISSSIKVTDTCDPVIYQMQPQSIKKPGEGVRRCDMSKLHYCLAAERHI